MPIPPPCCHLDILVRGHNHFPSLLHHVQSVHSRLPSSQIGAATRETSFDNIPVSEVKFSCDQQGCTCGPLQSVLHLVAFLLHIWLPRQKRNSSIGNIPDIPYFATGRDIRMLQLADFCAYAAFRRRNAGDDSLFKRILPRYDRRAPNHPPDGLKHITRLPCKCESCGWRHSPR